MEKRTIIISAAVVFLIMALVMAVSAFGFGIYYGDPELLRIAIFGEILTAVFLVWFIRRNSSFAAVGFSPLKIRGLVWYIPILLIVLYQVVLVVSSLEFDCFHSGKCDDFSTRQYIFVRIVFCLDCTEAQQSVAVDLFPHLVGFFKYRRGCSECESRDPESRDASVCCLGDSDSAAA